MKNILKHIIRIFLGIILLITFGQSSIKAICEITVDSISPTNIHACIGGFETEENLGDAIISANFWQTNGQPISEFIPNFSSATASDGTYYTCFSADIPNEEYQDRQLQINVVLYGIARCSVTFNPTKDEGKIIGSNQAPEFDMCNVIKNNADAARLCSDCATANGIWTSLGCISFNPKDFISDFLQIAIGLAGGVALLLMIYGSFLISTSAGDPKKSEEGKEIITGAIAGLLFIIFSVILLKIIGVDILSIPGL